MLTCLSRRDVCRQARSPPPSRRTIARAARASSRFATTLRDRASRLVERAGPRVRRSRARGWRSSASRPASTAPTAPGGRSPAITPAICCSRRSPNSGFSDGVYRGARRRWAAADGAIILNAVKCLPPQNKPTPEEIRTCRPFLETADRGAAQRARVRRARPDRASIGGEGAWRAAAQGALRRISPSIACPTAAMLIDSYHCSRYNQNTGRLTPRCSRRCSRGRWSCAPR